MGYKIDKVILKNYGIIGDFSANRFSNINLIIGENGTGKTFLLKALYSAVRSMEEFNRGDDIRTISELLSEKLRWTFQVERLGDMVMRWAKDGLSMEMEMGNDGINYQFSQSAVSKVGNAEVLGDGKAGNSVFIPAKEVLSLFSVILKSREIDKAFGFDDTYYDLAKALRISPSKGENYVVFANSRKLVSDVIDGRVEYDEGNGKWFYKNVRNQKFAIGATSESNFFSDEIESALHPKAVCQFLDMIDMLANDMGLQIFITSHSYFVIKKLFLIALKEAGMVTCISLDKGQEARIYDLNNEMRNDAYC